jgi:hypothetical protein
MLQKKLGEAAAKALQKPKKKPERRMPGEDASGNSNQSKKMCHTISQ